MTYCGAIEPLQRSSKTHRLFNSSKYLDFFFRIKKVIIIKSLFYEWQIFGTFCFAIFELYL